MTLGYRLIRFVVGGAVQVFYRRTHLGGAVPADGPLLLVANHPNGLVDPAVVANLTERPIRMLAKAPLFHMPVFKLVVAGSGALPVYRAKDGADTSQNAETFRAVTAALQQGHCVLIFPEGISHDAPHLQPLKTGAARMAMTAHETHGVNVRIVPIGLTYRDKERFRSEVATSIGAALTMVPGEDARALTERIDRALHEVTLNLDAWEDLPLLHTVDAIWRLDDPERAARLKELADGVALLHEQEPTRLAETRRAVEGFVARLAELGLNANDVSDETVAATASWSRGVLAALRTLLVFVVGMPAAILGAVWFFVPFWTVHAVYLLARPTRDVAATIKVMASVLFFPPWHVALSAWVWSRWGASAAVLAFALLPWCGLTTRWFFRDRLRSVRDVVAGLKLMLSQRQRRTLLAERAQLVSRFDALGQRVTELRATAPGSPP